MQEGSQRNASRTRVRAAWEKFNELAPILTITRDVSLNTEGKNIRCLCSQSVGIL